MKKRVLLITGTPCVGKTTVSQLLTAKLDALYVNLTDFAQKENLISSQDPARNTMIIDEPLMEQRLVSVIEKSSKNTIIIDGHFAAAVVPPMLVTKIFVLRRDPIELRSFMENCGFSNNKLWENLASEILDVCLIEALHRHEIEKVCEFDVSSRTAELVVNKIEQVLEGQISCEVGCVDWLGKLEAENLLEEFLRV